MTSATAYCTVAPSTGERRELLGRRGEAVLGAPADGDGRAVGDEPARAPEPDAAPAAGDERGEPSIRVAVIAGLR